MNTCAQDDTARKVFFQEKLGVNSLTSQNPNKHFGQQVEGAFKIAGESAKTGTTCAQTQGALVSTFEAHCVELKAKKDNKGVLSHETSSITSSYSRHSKMSQKAMKKHDSRAFKRILKKIYKQQK